MENKTLILLVLAIFIAGGVFVYIKHFHNKKYFCYKYNSNHTSMDATELWKKDGIPGPVYKGFPEQITDEQAKQVKNTCCIPCAKKDGKCEPCQEYNIFEDNIYEGIQIGSDEWMEKANDAALNAVSHGGGPFSSVILQIDGKREAPGEHRVIRYWIGDNHVPDWVDPTAHAEVNGIRAASRQLGVLDLGEIKQNESKLWQPSEFSHCVIYSSAESCPMCLSAIYWAGIKDTIFGATRFDAKAPGVNFSDDKIYNELALPYKDRKHMKIRHSNANNSLCAFNYYKRNDVKRYGAAN